ncbi:MAG TPA: SDR family NAD(P)-dependent oxidoreductase [Solirubrobacterales bacterium]|nr:SDR family NAD(P)-dependent oxidoreductase [Solirubrobacterales bacterium]HMU27076.1 SDR family NAD(P)-dependent oxidoreductase [Solirubrobacterales bacterium]HMX70883.1 SDR family NAD(P)-dependent oxidoreductase [Solirubrobacterales bacterium]HNA22904.1 SDR family NAD(P)-dependent oxidoreductase [Solirubrobacterales bacterium]HNA43903.1 SDR family NAD(P)-dependent oxidoreductase [Solirubrobacterales bacterium]
MSEQQVGPKTIVITGAARGIGLATARILATRGNRVVMSDLDGELAAAEAEKIGDRAAGFGVDVTDRDAVREHLEMVEREFGPVDVMINNAGIASASPNILEQDPKITERTIDINLKGAMNGTIEAIRLMEPRRRGQVVNVASLAGIIGVKGLAAYSASKFGLVGFTESIRLEFADKGIKLTCVMPGPVDTGMMDGTSSSPLVSMLAPEEMATGIADAVTTGKPRVSLPRSSWLLARTISVLPPAIGIRVGHWTRIDRIYTEVDPAARAAYEERISR